MALRRTIAGNVARLRKDQGLSQEKLARLLKVNKQTVWRIEAGLTNATTDMLEALGKAFGVQPAVLLLSQKEAGVVLDGEVDRLAQRLEEVLHCLKKTTRLAHAYSALLQKRRAPRPD